MSIDLPPPRKAPRDEILLDALLPLLEEADRLQQTPPHQDTGDILPLLEENARLRKLAVQLSNLLGDLPDANGSR